MKYKVSLFLSKSMLRSEKLMMIKRTQEGFHDRPSLRFFYITMKNGNVIRYHSEPNQVV